MKQKTLFVRLLLATLLLAPTAASAQVTIGSGNPPSPQSLLDLDASIVKKGLHMPRLNEAERDALVSDTSDGSDKLLYNGLMIYNTDIGCIEIWNTQEWINVCIGQAGSVADIPFSACSNIRVYGQYYRNSPLTAQHYIVLPITVTKKGEYTLIATSHNGYYFQASGVFEETGVYEIRLEGMGTPAINQVDHLLITNNGNQIGTACDPTVTVAALTMGYQADCDNIEVFGTYKARRFMDTDNYVEMPVDVLQLGTSTVTTDMVNGIRFSGVQEFTAYGPQTLVLKGEGSPKQEGTFKYTFTTDGSVKTTCSFTVDFFSLLGTFEDPACNCLAIYEERPFVKNGEYWLQDCQDTDFPVTRTYCDIAGGGWTLVWSYSEATAYNTYVQSTSSGGTGNANRMEVSGAYWGVFQDRPTNRITTTAAEDGPTDYRINYANFRLNRNEWLHLPSGDRSLMKVRIADVPTDMNDEWALNNYGIISPRNAADNPILSQYGARANVPVTGKIYGKNWEVRATGGSYGGWDEMTNGARTIAIYSNASYCTHWDWSTTGNSTLFAVTPDRGGADNMMRMNAINNAFGWFGETQHNHHFGKCGGTAGDDYSFAVKTCGSGTGSLVPHSFNDGQGRYLQWFVR